MDSKEIDRLLGIVKAGYGTAKDSAGAKLKDAILGARDDLVEVTALRRQLEKAVRKNVQYQAQIFELDEQLNNEGRAPIVMLDGNFIMGARDELLLDQIAPGYAIIFTDEPKREAPVAVKKIPMQETPAPKIAKIEEREHDVVELESDEVEPMGDEGDTSV